MFDHNKHAITFGYLLMGEQATERCKNILVTRNIGFMLLVFDPIIFCYTSSLVTYIRGAFQK